MATARGRARPRKQRAGMAAIRAFWTFVLPGLAFLATYVSEHFLELGIARIPVALTLGAFAYGVKRYIDPDGRW